MWSDMGRGPSWGWCTHSTGDTNPSDSTCTSRLCQPELPILSLLWHSFMYSLTHSVVAKLAKEVQTTEIFPEPLPTSHLLTVHKEWPYKPLVSYEVTGLACGNVKTVAIFLLSRPGMGLLQQVGAWMTVSENTLCQRCYLAKVLLSFQKWLVVIGRWFKAFLSTVTCKTVWHMNLEQSRVLYMAKNMGILIFPLIILGWSFWR